MMASPFHFGRLVDMRSVSLGDHARQNKSKKRAVSLGRVTLSLPLKDW